VEYVPGPSVIEPVLPEVPPLTQNVTVPPVIVTVVPLHIMVTPSWLKEPVDPPLWIIVAGGAPGSPGHRSGAAVAEIAAGNTAHAIISSVAAVTAMRPAAVSPLLWFVLRSAGIFPTSIV
jgi:hypothetical protein